MSVTPDMHDNKKLARQCRDRAELVLAWSRYDKGGPAPPDDLGYDSTARLLLAAAEKLEGKYIVFENCNIGAIEIDKAALAPRPPEGKGE